MAKLTPKNALIALQNNSEKEIDCGDQTISLYLIVKIAKALEKNTTCKTLRMYRCGVGFAGSKALGKALKSNVTLEKLILSNNQVGDVGSKFLGEALEKNTSVKELNLYKNQIGNVGSKFLSQGLEKKFSLEVLGLGNNQIEDAGAKTLSGALKKNTTLKFLNLGGNQITETGMKFLGESYLLSLAPVIEFFPSAYIGLENLEQVLERALEKDSERVYHRLVTRGCDTMPLLIKVEAYRKVSLLLCLPNKSLPKELFVIILKYLKNN